MLTPPIATLIYVCGIVGLFYLNRDKSVHTSKALWLPVIYIWIEGSRSISLWLGISAVNAGDVQSQIEGSPLDTVIFAILLLIGLCVLANRKKHVLRLLAVNWAIVLYFLLCLLSIGWSDFPAVAFKHWFKSTGDLAMILIVVTERAPVAALSRLLSRTGFILIPLSILSNKYYPNLSRAYDSWTGQQSMTGLTTDKNLLGAVTLALLLGSVWSFLELLRSREARRYQRRILLAKGAIIGLGVYLLSMANSVTSEACCAVGVVILLATNLRFMRRYPVLLHALALSLVVGVTAVLFLGVGSGAVHALGRNSNLTGRTDIWAAVIPLARNPLIGAGFESFWLSPGLHAKLAELIPGLPLNEAHNGYIEVYLELGWIGLALIAYIWIDGYRRAVAAFRHDTAWRGVLIAYIVSAAVYNLTEAGFRMLHPMWIFFLLAVVGSAELRFTKGTQAVSGYRSRTAKQLQPAIGSGEPSETAVPSSAY